jgi:cAMP-dependent protein kinase regulator
MTAAQLGISDLDRAHALRLRGEFDDALRLAASVATASPENLGAVALVARLLLDRDRDALVADVATRLVDAWIRRGDLPAAWLAAQLLLEAGGSRQDALKGIAQAFGKGSPRVSAVNPKPPALPASQGVAPHFAKLDGDALLDAAEKCAARFLKTPDAVAANAPVPELPLFGALEPAALLKLLGRLELRELAAGQYLLRQGEEGREAFVLARGVVNVVREDAAGGPPVLLAALGPGALFGEMALVSGAPRAASAVAVEPIQVLSIGRAALEPLAREDAAIGRELGAFCYGRMIANLIRHSSILSAIEPGQRQDLMARFRTQSFAAGDVLVRQGEEPNSLYLIASGGVKVCSADPDGDAVLIAELGPGDVVGEISLVLRRPANADVVAAHATVALALTREQFHEAIRAYPGLLQQLYDLAIQRDDQTRSVLGQKAVDVTDVVLV